MWGIPGLIITIMIFYIISMYIYQRGRGLTDYEEVSREEFEKERGKRGRYSTNLAMFEILFLMSIVIQIIYYGFHYNQETSMEMVYVFFAGVVFVMALLRFNNLWTMRLYYTRDTLVMEKGLYKKEIPLEKVEEAVLVFYWLGIVRKDKFFFTFIPLGFKNMREVKSLLNNGYEKAKEREEDQMYEDKKRMDQLLKGGS